MNNALSVKIISFFDKKIDRKYYFIILLLYAVLLTVTACFHEPWGDEAQAWQIARCASLYDIIFKIPHFEGHPQLWHLILVPFAKSGMPYEFSIKFINILFSTIAVGVMLYKTQLSDMLKATVPFTYFVFYQYGVISRNYCLMFLALMLCAAEYGKRNEKPFRYVLPMILLCLSSAYGMAIACGFCIVWILEYLRSGPIKNAVKSMAKSGVLAGLFVMLISAVVILLFIIPKENDFHKFDSTRADFLSSMVYGLFGSLYDATVGNLFNKDIGLANVEVISANLLYIIPVAVIIWIAVIYYGKKKKKLAQFLIPFAVLDMAFIFVRMGGHHIGITTLLLIYWLCICSEKDDSEEYEETKNEKTVMINCGLTVIMCIVIFVQCIWTILSVITEINYNYSIGREIGRFINENNISYEDNNVYSYSYLTSKSQKLNGAEELIILDYSLDAVTFLPYIDENILGNFNFGENDKAYILHEIYFDSQEYYDEIEYVKSLGIPKYIFGSPQVIDMDSDYDDLWNESKKDYEFSYYFNEHNYKIVKSVAYKMIFKGSGILYYYDVYELNE